ACSPSLAPIAADAGGSNRSPPSASICARSCSTSGAAPARPSFCCASIPRSRAPCSRKSGRSSTSCNARWGCTSCCKAIPSCTTSASMSWRSDATSSDTVARLTDPAQALKTLHWGRNYLYVTRVETADDPHGGVDVVVKQFRILGLRDRLRRRFRGSKAAKSWRVANALIAAGLQTPEPVLLIEAETETGPSFYVCRYLADVQEARYLLRAANAGTERQDFAAVDFPHFLEALGKMARRLHDAGFWHRDLSSGNVLLRTDAAGKTTDLYLIDLNRTRMGKALTLSERLRDLSRMPILRPEHQDLFLASYWGGAPKGKSLYLFYHRAFLWKNDTKKKLRGGLKGLRGLFKKRVAHAHIPDAPADASSRDRVVWDRLSDQPHQHAGRFEKLRVRLADAPAHVAEGLVIAAAAPRIWRRYKELQADL